jgi:hypothetical protein
MNEGTAFYRCKMCRGVVSPWDIQEGGCRNFCKGSEIVPTNLSLFEKLMQIIRHPKVWTWPQ